MVTTTTTTTTSKKKIIQPINSPDKDIATETQSEPYVKRLDQPRSIWSNHNKTYEHLLSAPYYDREDPDRKRREERGFITTWESTTVPTGDGGFITVSSDDLRKKKSSTEPYYDNRYEAVDKGEGAGKGYADDPDNYSNSGLKV